MEVAHTRRNVSQLKKWVTLGKMDHTWKIVSHVERYVTLRKFVTVGNLGHTWENGSHLEKWVMFGKMGHT